MLNPCPYPRFTAHGFAIWIQTLGTLQSAEVRQIKRQGCPCLKKQTFLAGFHSEFLLVGTFP